MMNSFAKLAAFLSLNIFAAIAVAAEEPSSAPVLQSPLGAGAIVETLLGLLLVLGLIVLIAWLLRRTGGFQMSSKGEIKIITSMALGPRERAVLLQVGEQQLLVGVTAQQIQTLHVLEKNIASDSSSNVPSSFANKLQKVMQQGKTPS